MKVEIEIWEEALSKLRTRRVTTGYKDDNIKLPRVIRDYGSHLQVCGYGESVLDVGCGSQKLKLHLPESVKYIGIDAYPVDGCETIQGTIEEIDNIEVDTVCAMAVLDNCIDFYKACENIKKMAKKNVIVLTGIGIDVDQYHTFRLEHEHFAKAFEGWNQTVREELEPKVWLFNFEKP